MRKNLPTLVITLAIFALLGGCSAYNKLLKSGDRELIYDTAMAYFDQGKFDKAVQLFQEVEHFYQGTSREDTILYFTGMSLYNMRDYESSEIILDDFRRRFGRSPFLEDAEYMYAMGYYHMSPEPYRDQTVTMRAIAAINEYLIRYPESMFKDLCTKRLEELHNKLYDKELINASTYYKIGRYKSAVIALQNGLDKYPNTPHREEFLYMITKSSYELAANSVEVLQRDRYLDMMDSYYNFISEFPESKHRREMDRLQASARKYLEEHPTDATVVEPAAV